MRIFWLSLLFLTISIAPSAQQTKTSQSGRGEEEEVVRVQNTLINAYINRMSPRWIAYLRMNTPSLTMTQAGS
jgi:hypothetical protein